LTALADDTLSIDQRSDLLRSLAQTDEKSRAQAIRLLRVQDLNEGDKASLIERVAGVKMDDTQRRQVLAALQNTNPAELAAFLTYIGKSSLDEGVRMKLIEKFVEMSPTKQQHLIHALGKLTHDDRRDALLKIFHNMTGENCGNLAQFVGHDLQTQDQIEGVLDFLNALKPADQNMFVKLFHTVMDMTVAGINPV
jgi:hypothetical protein